ncbi:hypothetical protein [Egbenema bharatensis]|uniref:hypothetical protein n=1 Tax=Egbenema bharatensis TaxID=3463334 RepID=UPI003A8712C5
MVDNHNFRNRSYDDPYNNPRDYPNSDDMYDRSGDRVYSRHYYEPGEEPVSYSTRNASVDRPYDPTVRTDVDRSVDRRPANPTEVSSTRGLTRRNRYSDDRPVDPYYRSDIQEVHRSNNIAIGLLLGVLLTSIIGILAAIFYFATAEPQPTNPPTTAPNTTEPAPTEPQDTPTQP